MESDSDDNLIDEDELGQNLPNNFNFSFSRRPQNSKKETRTKYRNGYTVIYLQYRVFR